MGGTAPELGAPGGWIDRSDEDLMLAYRRGETAAFEALLRRHERGVYRFALRFLGDRMKAEEVTQESFLRIIRAASRYEPRASFRAYLYRIARNLCLDLVRRKPREMRAADRPADCGAAGLEEAADQRPGPESRAGADQMRALIGRALRRLPPEQREVFLLKEVREMSLQDVAEVTGANLNTVKSRLRYALLRLREELESQGIGGEIGDAL
ncbi:MAG: RNA polymerase sigma factor [bacterium]